MAKYKKIYTYRVKIRMKKSMNNDRLGRRRPRSSQIYISMTSKKRPKEAYGGSKDDDNDDDEEKSRNKIDPVWRKREIEKRIMERREQKMEPCKSLIEAGKRQLMDRTFMKNLEQKYEKAVEHFDGTTNLSLVEKDQMQSVLLRRSEQSWDTAKQLRTMKTTIRRAAEGKKEYGQALDTLEQKILDLRELTTAIDDEDEHEDEDENEDAIEKEKEEKHENKNKKSSKRAKATLTQIQREHGRNRVIADNQIDAEIALVKSHKTETSQCPKCERLILNSYIQDHVKSCKEGDESGNNHGLGTVSTTHEAFLDGASRKIVEIEKQARRKAAKQLDRALNSKRNSYLATVQVCPECGKQVLSSRLKKHLQKCQEQQRILLRMRAQQLELARQAALEKGTLEESEALGRMPPLAPINFRLVDVTSSSIEVQWEPPIFMGGYNIFVHDYVIEYAICTRRKHGKKVQVEITPQKPIQTSIFCSQVPVCRGNFIIKGLSSQTEYVNLRVRAKNVIGLSEPSNEIETVTTDKLGEPSPPLHLMLARATSSMLVFVWSEPTSTGGAANGIKYYEFTCSYFVHRSVEMGKVLNTETFRIDAPIKCYTMQGLDPNAKVQNISVVAVTEEFVNGEKTVKRSEPSNHIKQVSTMEPDREDLLRLEIQRISHMNDAQVDSNVYQGFSQRYSKADLMNRLTMDLKRMENRRKKSKRKVKQNLYEAFPLRLLVENFGFNAVKSNHLDMEHKRHRQRQAMRPTMMEANKLLGMADIARRRFQFQYRMNRLGEQIEQIETERGELIMRRALLTKELEGEEHRITSLKAEHDRVSAHGGEFIDSAVMHGRLQRFQTWSLTEALEEEIRASTEKLARGKREQVKVQQKLVKLGNLREKQEMALKDRKARLVAFEKEVEKKQKALHKVQHWRLKRVFDYFHLWADAVQAKRIVRGASQKFLKRMKNLELYRGWRAWKNYMQILDDQEQEKKGITGLGSFMLAHVHDEREELKGGAAEVLFRLRSTTDELSSLEMTASQRNKLESSPFFDLNLEQQRSYIRDHPELFAQQVIFLKQGQTYLKMNQCHKALACFEHHIHSIGEKNGRDGNGSRNDDNDEMNDHEMATTSNQELEQSEENKQLMKAKELDELCECYYGMAVCLKSMQRIDKALVNFDRTRSLAVEAGCGKMHGLSLLGTAQCNTINGFYKVAIEYADRALIKFEDLNDSVNMAKAYRELERAYHGIFDQDRAITFSKLAQDLENEMEIKLRDTFGQIERAERKMISITADRSTEVKLEVVSAHVPDLRIKIEDCRNKAESILAESKHHARANEIDTNRLEQVKKQLVLVRNCKKEELDSDLVHGVMQRFKVKELLRNLEIESERLQSVIENRATEKEKADIRASNVLDDMQELEKTLAVELGPLMRKVIMGKQRFRCCGMNPANLRSRDVSGLATGGIEKVACCMRDSIYVFDLRDGALLSIIDGSKTVLDPNFEHKRSLNPNLDIPGHHGSITSVFYSEHNIITGGVDMLIRVWEDSGQHKCKHLLRGHTGSIWSLYADAQKIVSGSADCSVRVWSLQRKAKCVRVLPRAHRRAVTCLDVDGTTLATGSPDYEVRVWPNALKFGSSSIDPKSNMTSFIGHDCPISCVKISATELISGGEDGRIIIWSTETGEKLNICLGHTLSIRSIQADSTKVVSGSIDNTICVFDFATGTKLLTLRGHEDPIMSLQFDQYRILSISSDGSMRFWHWSGSTTERLPSYDKLHVLQQGETLAKLEEMYGSSIQNLKKWNNIQGNDASKTLYTGMRLIVKKGALTADV